MVDIEDLRKRFLDLEFDSNDFELDADKLATVAKAAGETRPQYTDPEHPDFQALPSFLASLASGRRLPIDFPSLGGIGMDGGKAVRCVKPVKAGVKLTGKTRLHDIYDKSGRSGRMIFLVSRMDLYGPDDEHLATTDSRTVIREKPSE